MFYCGTVAQLVEQLTLNQLVEGSSPFSPTNINKAKRFKMERIRSAPVRGQPEQEDNG